MVTRHRNSGMIDYWLLVAVVLLVVLGLIMVYSATFTMRTDSFYFLKQQILWVIIGGFILSVTARFDYRLLRKWALPIMAAAILLLVGVLLIGQVSGGSQAWFLNGRVQPSEVAKVAFIVYSAAWLASKGEKVKDVTYGLVPYAIMVGIITGLILVQPDLGTALLMVFIAGAMFFSAGAELSQLLVVLITGGPVLALIILKSGHTDRLGVFMDPLADPQGAGYQMHGILAALRSGGFFGRGLGASELKFIPPWVHHTDTIFPLIGEELGLAGCLLVIGLFSIIAYRALHISLRAPDDFGAFVALGVACWITIQALIHMAVNTNTLPFTGLTLPFVSYGGSSLVSLMLGVGLLLNVSRAGQEREIRRVATFAFGRRNRRPRLSRAFRR